jgi:hypothetical protein
LNSAHDRREAGLVALSVDIALVMLGGDVSGDREPRLALHDLGRLRGGGDAVPHLREDGGEKGVMRAVGPGGPREGEGRKINSQSPGRQALIPRTSRN